MADQAVNMEAQSNAKRTRDDSDIEVQDEASKKQKVDEEPIRIQLAFKAFGSSVEMFDYFYKFLHYWPANINLNKYEHMVLEALLRKGHVDAETKIGGGIKSFQVRYHPLYKSRCFFLIRHDDSSDDFSFRKCIDRILPLPENMKVRSEANKSLGGGGGRGRGRGGRFGGGRGGGFRGGNSKSRN